MAGKLDISEISSKKETIDENILYQKYEFSPEIKVELHKYLESDNYHGVLQCIEDWGIIIGIILISERFFTTSWYFYLIAVIIIGSRMRALFVVMHDSNHKCLAKNTYLNLFLGTVLSAWPVFCSWTNTYEEHIKLHHQYLGHPKLDGDLIYFQNIGLAKDGITKSEVVTYLLSTFNPKNVFIIAFRRLISQNFGLFENNLEKTLRFMYMGAIFWIFYHFELFLIVVKYWIIPLITTYQMFFTWNDFFEHYPLFILEHKKELYMTRNRLCTPIENLFLGCHNEGYHLLHHCFPKIPSWNYPAAHKIMMQDENYKKINGDTYGWPAIVKRMLKDTEGFSKISKDD